MKPQDFRKKIEKERKETPFYQNYLLSVKLIRSLRLPALELPVTASSSPWETTDVFENDQQIQEALLLLVEQLPSLLEVFRAKVKEATEESWFQNDFNDAGFYILDHLEKALEDPLAVIEFYSIFDHVQAGNLYRIANLFIRYAPLDLVEADVLLNKFGSTYYRSFIERFPKEQLDEFLTSNRKEARVLAKNKLKASCE